MMTAIKGLSVISDHAFTGAVAGVVLMQAAGIALAGPSATAVACLMMLVLGLPHGTLDLQLIARTRAAGRGAVLALYLALAGATFLFWQLDPVAALAMFVIVAVVHFAEDWAAMASPFLAHGTALAVLAAPALLWREEMRALFVAVAGDAAAGGVADLLLVVAPTTLAIGAVGLAALWREGRRDQALAGAAALTGMIVLPPAIGFALFFCLFHSPRHFREALTALDWHRVAHWRGVVVPLTAAALALATALALIEPRAAAGGNLIAASFMTLSILTVPHMLVPMIVAAWSGTRPVAASG